MMSIPYYSCTWNMDLHVAGIDSVSRLGEFDLNAVTPEYFATLGTRMLRGRGIGAEDTPHAPRVMVVSDAMAKALWPGRDPLGQCVRVGADTAPCSYVVGVAASLGAQERDLIKLVINEGLRVGVVGIVIGVMIALAGGQWLGPLLFQESPHDPLVLGFVTVVLLGTTVLASFVPSRRAARVDPMVALRYE